MDYPDYTTEHQKGKHLTYETNYYKSSPKMKKSVNDSLPLTNSI